jgi:CBS domain-containing protein
MIVRDAMTRRAETIAPGETLQTAARKMRELRIGALPVCENDRLVGMLTDRDIVIRSTAEALDPAQATVATAMTPQVIYCFDDEDIYTAARLMEERAVRRLMVLDSEKRLVGLLSVDDLSLVSQAAAAGVVEHSRAPEGRGATPDAG